jgi:malonate transporter and related proteins
MFQALLPVFAVILLGFALSRSGVIAEDHWKGIDQICYHVLFPAFFFKEIGSADFSGVPVLATALAMALAIAAASALLFAFSRPIRAFTGTDGPQFSSLFQGVVRWHTFVAFAAVPLYYGQGAIPLAALAAAVMTPLLNLICVPMIAHFRGSAPVSFGRILIEIAKNPFFYSSFAGGLWNVSGLGLNPQVFQTLDIAARGALGLALLAVGAGLRFDAMAANVRAISMAVALKLLGMPAMVWLALKMMGVEGEAAAVAILCNAVPTGSGAYVLARQMGGDAVLMANILTIQVICAAVTIPLVVWLSG